MLFQRHSIPKTTEIFLARGNGLLSTLASNLWNSTLWWFCVHNDVPCVDQRSIELPVSESYTANSVVISRVLCSNLRTSTLWPATIVSTLHSDLRTHSKLNVSGHKTINSFVISPASQANYYKRLLFVFHPKARIDTTDCRALAASRQSSQH